MIVAFRTQPVENQIVTRLFKAEDLDCPNFRLVTEKYMKEGYKRIEMISNIAIIVLAILLGGMLISRYFTQPGPPPPASENSMLTVGTKLPTSNVDWSASEKNLVLVLSTTCRFCAESVPFYQRLTERNAKDKSVRVIAVLPETVDASRQYLSENQIAVDEVLKGNPSDLMVRGTPTLILIDKIGIVLNSWVGKLPSDKENEVLTKVFSSAEVRTVASGTH